MTTLKRCIMLLALFAGFSLALFGAPDTSVLPPDVRDVAYGTAQRQKFDLWKAPSDTSTPVCICFHGGGFGGGDKSYVPRRVMQYCLAQHIAVISADYRLAYGKDGLPLPAALLDGARVVQCVRSRAKEWGIDPARIALYGESAGGVIVLWVGMHAELADPKADDPIARTSSRVSCVISRDGQATIDPRSFREADTGMTTESYRTFITPFLPVFGAASIKELDSPRIRKVIEECSPLNYASATSPPVYLGYGGTNIPLPLPAGISKNVLIHHPFTGMLLKKKLDACGAHCEFYYGGHDQFVEPQNGVMLFLQKYLVGTK